MADQGREGWALLTLADDHQPAGADLTHPGEGPDQGREVLLSLEPACPEQDGGAFALEPGMGAGRRCPLPQVGRDHRVANDHDGLPRQAGDGCGVRRDPRGDGDDAVEVGIQAANGPIAPGPAQGRTARQGGREVGPQAQDQTSVDARQGACQHRRPSGPILCRQQGSRPCLAEIAGQGRDCQQTVLAAQGNAVDRRRQSCQVGALITDQ